MNKQKTALIFDIERNSFVDGPGIRTTVFFKGCNLKCQWCHNPESQCFDKELVFYRNKCSSCGRCAGITIEDADFLCYNDAKEICGREYTVDAVLAEVVKDKLFYDNSGGGVTFSGGECMLQTDFLEETLKLCKEQSIHTAVDTAGAVQWKKFEQIIPYTDLFLYDIKTMDDNIHKKYTGVGNILILDNLSRILTMGKPVWVRIPVVPGVNDTETDMLAVREFFDKYGYPERVNLLPYHQMGEHKYAALNMEIIKFDIPGAAKMQFLESIVLQKK